MNNPIQSNGWNLSRWALALALGGAVMGAPSASGAAMVFPGAAWAESTPQAQGVSTVRLNAAMQYLAYNCGAQKVSQAVVIRNGYLIWKGTDIDNKHGTWSATKSFTSTVLGLLIEDGKCALDTPAASHVPTLQAQYPEVALRHFTTMTSGYMAAGDLLDDVDHGQTATPFTPTNSLFAPGAKYAYWDSAMNQFANVLTRIAGEPIETLFQRRIADPIGMNRTYWDWLDFGIVDGYPHAVNGGAGNKSKSMNISAREMARFGHLFLNRGNWNGTQLISAAWIELATRNQVPTNIPPYGGYNLSGPGCYGYNWWMNGIKADGTRKFPHAPRGLFMALGANNNKCIVIPEWSMVIVRLGTDGSVDDAVYDMFLLRVGEAVADPDTDGMADEWEAAAFTTPAQCAPTADDDGDGLTNLEEYRAGTHPANLASLVALRAESGDSAGSISWETVLALEPYHNFMTRCYSLETSDRVNSPVWTAVPGYVKAPATGAPMSFTASGAAAFYRLRVWLE